MKPDWTGRTVEAEVGPVAHGGHCVSRVDGRVVFVRHALPGEVVLAEVTEDGGGSFCRADAVRVLRAAPERVEPPCPVAGPGLCGGCDWQHASPAAQRALKADVVAEQLRRLAGLTWPVEVEPLPGGPLRWRTRVRFVAGRDGHAGLRAHRSHRVVPLADCPITAPAAVGGGLRRRWRPGSEIEVTADADARTHVRVVETVRGRERARQHAGGVAHQRAAGRDWRLAAHGFWQVHPGAADTFAAVVGEWARPSRGARVWDLYAGVGLFAAVLAERVGPDGGVLAVESGGRAVSDGQANLADLPQVRWHRGRVERVLRDVGERPEVVVLDPPRKGAGREVVDAIAAGGPERVVYVACDPAALARDVAAFAGHGYRLDRLRAFDAFPMTHHVECLALLTR
ncbi:23S rRNA m(5)U-1939 methyltransferase [Prauserella shujinwangii]|uniref:23S rRNA m(5)U-1939 methyltransferase n=1 Tax=Prauserella shujinwangii TaxID=1453103 RepID=A0A2T0M3E6_9PSEU|nr:class I SAM-dependent RNA methyltransferase [Prauserella shujinwangii]PRX51281.1 23S rRNA m(5)U-1939 methyltransferase [Prauserella shujinwangii]